MTTPKHLVNKRPQRRHVNREETLVQIRLAREVALENTALLTAEKEGRKIQ